VIGSVGLGYDPTVIDTGSCLFGLVALGDGCEEVSCGLGLVLFNC
jgi:hypothetical protein